MNMRKRPTRKDVGSVKRKLLKASPLIEECGSVSCKEEFVPNNTPNVGGLVLTTTREKKGIGFSVLDEKTRRVVAEKVSSEDRIEFVLDEGRTKVSINVHGVSGDCVFADVRFEKYLTSDLNRPIVINYIGVVEIEYESAEKPPKKY